MKLYDVDKIPDNINIGLQGENNATMVGFNIATWKAEYGEGVTSLIIKRPGDAVVYPATIHTDDTLVTWIITNTETAITGVLQASLDFRVNDVIKKSRLFTCVVFKSLDVNTDTPPEPYESYVGTIIENAVRAEESATNAAESARLAQEFAHQAQDIVGEPLEIREEDGNITISFREV